MAQNCSKLPCCSSSGEFFAYSLSRGPLYGNPLIEMPGGGAVVEPITPPGGGPIQAGMKLTVSSACCDGSGFSSVIIIPYSAGSQSITAQCCNGSTVTKIVTAGMSASQVLALGIQMAAECTQSNECGENGPGGPFFVTFECCDGSIASGEITPDMTVAQIGTVASNMVAECAAKQAACDAAAVPGDPPTDPNVFYPNLKVGNDGLSVPVCDPGFTLTINASLPSWAAVLGNNLLLAENQFFVVPASNTPAAIAAAKTLANTKALTFFNAYIAAAFLSGDIECVEPSPCSTFFETLVWSAPAINTGDAGSASGTFSGFAFTAHADASCPVEVQSCSNNVSCNNSANHLLNPGNPLNCCLTITGASFTGSGGWSVQVFDFSTMTNLLVLSEANGNGSYPIAIPAGADIVITVQVLACGGQECAATSGSANVSGTFGAC